MSLHSALISTQCRITQIKSKEDYPNKKVSCIYDLICF